MDCKNAEGIQSLGKYIEENSAKLKPSISKTRGRIAIIKRPAFQKPKKRSYCSIDYLLKVPIYVPTVLSGKTQTKNHQYENAKCVSFRSGRSSKCP